jgi:two-component system, NarL family, invasion response regulator UvrY
MKILLVDDHSIVRAGLRGLLATIARTELVEAATGEEALALVRVARPDLVILDLNLPGIGGMELVRRLLAEDKTVRLLVLSMLAEPLYAARAIEAGARGYMSKNAAPEELLRAVRKVAEGGRYIENEIAQELAMQTVSATNPLDQLADRDLEILRFLAEGRSMTEIAGALGLGYKTVANACSQIKGKLGVARTADLIRIAIEIGVAPG